jgi:hypothetical protein
MFRMIAVSGDCSITDPLVCIATHRRDPERNVSATGKRPTSTANLMFRTKATTPPAPKRIKDEVTLSSHKSPPESVARAAVPNEFDDLLLARRPSRTLFRTVGLKDIFEVNRV